MTLTINTAVIPLTISDQLQAILNKEYCLSNPNVGTGSMPRAITFNFRDPSYSAEQGGFHPVEIRIERSNEAYNLCYITDFSFVGSGYCTELAKEIDFDFLNMEIEVRMMRPAPLVNEAEFYTLFESNFIRYYEVEVYQVQVESEP